MAALVTVVASGLVACTTPIPTPVEPVSLFDTRCADLVTMSDVEFLAGPDAREREPDLLRPSGWPWGGRSLHRAAIAQAGGTLCEWGSAGEGDARIQISALSGVDAQELGIFTSVDQERRGAAPTVIGDATVSVWCTDHYPETGPTRCAWIASKEDVVLEAYFPDVPLSEFRVPAIRPDPLTSIPVVEAVLDSASGRVVLHALDRLVESGTDTRIVDADAPSCEELFPAELRVAEGAAFWIGDPIPESVPLSVALAWGDPSEAQVLGSVAQHQLGWTRCSIYQFDPADPLIDGVASASVLFAPGLAWIVDDAVRGPWGDHPEAVADCGDDRCEVALVLGSDLVLYVDHLVEGPSPELAHVVLDAMSPTHTQAGQ